MKLALLGRQALMGAMAVVLMTGVSVKTFAAENLLNQVTVQYFANEPPPKPTITMWRGRGLNSRKPIIARV